MSKNYDCTKCPAYCCSYPIIPVSKRDVERLAKHFGLDFETAEKRFTYPAEGHKRVLRRQADPHFGRICKLFDVKERRCTVYMARPSTCRLYPAASRCGYYDFLKFERRHQADDDFVASTAHGPQR